jgi:hypothetical protein
MANDADWKREVSRLLIALVQHVNSPALGSLNLNAIDLAPILAATATETVTAPPKNICHVVPENDTIEHVTDGVCPCAPRVEKVGDGLLVVHDAMDGRP